jgi:AcrR family transcriptional regulator
MGKVGRPAQITRERIADAVAEIGLDRVTMKAVAERLGVSVPGLYHHVRGKDDLVRIGLERSMAQVALPEDHGQAWDEWLRDWARYTRQAMIAQPEVLGQFVNGTLDRDRMAIAIDRVMQVLAREGFTPKEALDAFRTISNCAVGSVVEELREQKATDEGRPQWAEIHRALAQHDLDELPGLRALARAVPERDADANFDEEITIVLAGIAARRSVDPVSQSSASAGSE